MNVISRIAFQIRAGRDEIEVNAYLINSNQNNVEVLKGTSQNYPHGFVGYEKIRELAEKMIRRFVLNDLSSQPKFKPSSRQLNKSI